MTERLTNKWTDTLEEAFGTTPEVEKGVLAEQMYLQWASNVYPLVEYFPDDKEMQVAGIDFYIKKDNWRRKYGVDVKGNMDAKGFFIVDNMENGWLRGSNKKNDRVCHICVESGWAIEYDRKDMMKYLGEPGFGDDLVAMNSMSPNIKDFTRRFKVK